MKKQTTISKKTPTKKAQTKKQTSTKKTAAKTPVVKKSRAKEESKKSLLMPISIVMVILIIMLLIGISCVRSGIHKTTKVFDGVLDAGTYTTIDYSYEDKLNKDRFDNWSGCTAIAKNIGDNTIIGRNMDMTISDKAAYIYKTNIKGKYKTLNLAYTHRDYSPDYKDALNGLDEDFYNYLPFISDDVLNEKGLYIEVNMRLGEGDKFSCSGTNPGAEERVYMFSLPIFIGLNAANIDEALDYVKTLDVYSMDGYWNYSFLIADATGRYGVLEFSDNKYWWNEGQNAQANFYVTEELSAKNELKAGVGRYNYVREHIDEVNSKEDMFSLMNDIRYSQAYTDSAKFDVRSEFVDTQAICGYENDKSWTYDYITEDEEGKAKLASCLDVIQKVYPFATRDELKAVEAWESSFTEVIDIKNREIRVRFFEDNNKIYTLKFDN